MRSSAGQRVRIQDHVQGHRDQARRSDPKLPQQLSPRIAVTVDLDRHRHRHQAGRDRDVHAVVRSRVLFEQMKGAACASSTPMNCAPSRRMLARKTRFRSSIAWGSAKRRWPTPNRWKRTPRHAESAAGTRRIGGTNDDYLSSLARRIARIDQQCGPDERKRIADVTGGVPLSAIAGALVRRRCRCAKRTRRAKVPASRR